MCVCVCVCVCVCMRVCKFTGIFYSACGLLMAVGCFIQENRDRYPKSGA